VEGERFQSRSFRHTEEDEEDRGHPFPYISGRKLHEEMGLGFYEISSKNFSMEKKLFSLKDVRKKADQAAEVEMIRSALQWTHWNRGQAAKLLSMNYNALLYKIQKYNLRGS
jgi:DNA-binding NtrC family response regulator